MAPRETHDDERIHCVIRVKGQIDVDWSDWFLGLEIEHQSDGETSMSGALPDQVALHGVLTRIRDLGLPLLSIDVNESD